MCGGRNELPILIPSGGRIGDLAASPSVKRKMKESMFARHITLQLKPNFAKEFPVHFEKEIVPLLKQRKGFVDELLLMTPEKKEVVAISLWEKKEHAENYHRELYPKVEKLVEKYIEGAPVIKEFEAEYSTFHKIAFAAMA
jgi:heme-degrading monooxygenase HmoA